MNKGLGAPGFPDLNGGGCRDPLLEPHITQLPQPSLTSRDPHQPPALGHRALGPFLSLQLL